MFLRCVECGDLFYLAKWFPVTGWYPPAGRSEPMEEAFAAWLDDHDGWSGGNHGGREPVDGYDDRAEEYSNGRWWRLAYEEDVFAAATPLTEPEPPTTIQEQESTS